MVDIAAGDPSTIIYTSGTTGPPKGALLPHAVMLGNLPGFEHSHDGFPREGDLFWTPADWAWTGGLWDALMPTLYHGRAILGYRGRFEPERALALMDKYQVRNSFIVPTALKLMMRAVPRPRERYDVQLRTLIEETRIEQACRYLTSSSLSVSEIAYRLGFAHPPAFHRAFRRSLGDSPLHYRRTHAQSSVYRYFAPDDTAQDESAQDESVQDESVQDEELAG
jgi:acyl-CoA synthetase (AMP-forming)/AMP-acid ligase II